MGRVELDDVRKSFGTTEVVKGVSIDVESGEFLVLVGPSGCGKSTCLRMIAGLETVTSGEIRIADRRVNELSPKERNIGMVFQSYALYPHMTVRENMGFGLSLQKVNRGEIDRRIVEVAESLDLSELLGRKPKELSGGQRQRVAIGRAVVKSPNVFLFDEPLSNLDAALRVQMRGELATLHDTLKTTMVYVTHDQVEAMMLADRIAVLDGGVLQQIGAPLEVYNNPANRFVASFIGSPSMNFIAAELSHDGDDVVVQGVGLKLVLPDFDGKPDSRAVELGVRPQDVRVGSGDLQGQVTLVEMLGWEAFVHVDVEGTKVVARVEGEEGAAIRTGDSVSLDIRSSTVHVFDDVGTSVWCGR